MMVFLLTFNIDSRTNPAGSSPKGTPETDLGHDRNDDFDPAKRIRL